MKKRFLLLFITFFLTIATAVACSSSNDANDEKNNEDEEEASQTEADENAGDEEDQNGDGNTNNEENDFEDEQNNEDNITENNDQDDNQSNQDQKSSDNDELPEKVVFDEQIQHPDGVLLTLEEMTFEENHIEVSFNVENHSGRNKALAKAASARNDTLGGITLQDDTGFDYRYVADENSRLTMKNHEKIDGTVSFSGRLQDDAESLTLIFNPGESVEFVFEDIEIKR